ncbi:unnamed protein product [Hydatigera taeniaeformis]|uniref:DUF4147 domain-containing protein n=1 Tax=Hydatigena taeniaeformis TaxID=6205 RepID=A0A0R3WTD7_HYDTA|nr:unnamed protein product [Hydatigera taeniaeformis]
MIDCILIIKATIFPVLLQLITDDVNVLLNNDNIVIESATSEEAAELISNIAYVKPRSTSTQLTFGPPVSNARAIELATVFSLENLMIGEIY